RRARPAHHRAPRRRLAQQRSDPPRRARAPQRSALLLPARAADAPRARRPRARRVPDRRVGRRADLARRAVDRRLRRRWRVRRRRRAPLALPRRARRADAGLLPVPVHARRLSGARQLDFLLRPLRGIFAPFLRALFKPMAIACLRLLILCLPLRMWCISVRTERLALRELFERRLEDERFLF